MQSILLHNFKSYDHQAITNLNSRINVVLGSNGQGKSNFFKAISFLFTERYTINRAEFNATLHRGAKVDKPQILVQVNFSQKSEDKNFKIAKSWTNLASEDLKINDKSLNKGQFENFIDSFGLSYTNPYNIVQQGKIAEISQMSENQLYLLLEDIAGVKRFMKKSEEAQKNLAKIQTDLNEAEQNLKFLKEKVSEVQDKKNEYEFYSVEEKVRKIKKKRQLINFAGAVEITIKKMRQRHQSILKELQETKMNEAQLKKEIQQRQNGIKVLTQKAFFYQKQNSDLIEQTNALSKKPLPAKKKDLKQLEKKIAIQQKALQQSQNKLNSLEKQLNAFREKYEIIKIDFQVTGQSKDQKQIKDAYQAKIQAEKDGIKTFQDELKKLARMRDECKMVNYSAQTKELHALQSEMIPLVDQLKKLKIHQIQFARNKINIECEIQTLSTKNKSLDDILRKIMPMIDLRLKHWLRENKVEGVHGYLIEHLKIDKDVAFAYELAGLSKLCTLLVQNDQVAAKVIQINKKLNGKAINILPLSYVKTQAQQKRPLPKSQDVFSLINPDWIKVANSQNLSVDTKALIQKVVSNTFSRYALVENYSTALKVSKEYNLDCITGDREIVYADAYLCKVGREETFEKGKIQLFENLQALVYELHAKKLSLTSIQQKQVELQNKEIELSNKKEKIDLKISQLQKNIEQAKRAESLIQKLEAKQANLQESIQKSKQNILQYENYLQKIQNNTKSKFRPEDFKKAEAQYFSHKSKVQKIFQENQEKSKDLSNLMKDFEALKTELASIQKKDSSLPELESKQQILKGLENSKQKHEEALSNLNKQLPKLTEKHTQIKQKQIEMLSEITVEEQNQKYVKAKLDSLTDINPEDEEQIEQLSHSLSRRMNADSINVKKKQFFTTRDKVFFTKITNYIEQVNSFAESTKTIRNEEKKLLSYIELTEKEASKYMKQFLVNFEKHFINYFLRFVPNGKAELKTKIYTQKVKGITKNGHSLEMQVGFNSEEGIRKWSEFSGGQKTVLSLCIILAIQKCEPAPFCVLDEVDAALDQFYVKRLVEIVEQESKFCQYFITSFKKPMLDFPEEIANYYLVSSVNKVSNITLVGKEEAEGFIEQLAE